MLIRIDDDTVVNLDKVGHITVNDDTISPSIVFASKGGEMIEVVDMESTDEARYVQQRIVEEVNHPPFIVLPPGGEVDEAAREAQTEYAEQRTCDVRELAEEYRTDGGER